MVIWKREDGSACGGTEGTVLGVTGDEVCGEYLVLDRSTYQGSFKSDLLSFDILDLRVVPLKDVESVERTGMRRRPPGIDESCSMKMEANYRSNIDFSATLVKVRKRSDCKITQTLAPQSDAVYGIGIKKIETIEGASVTISANGTLQIFCFYRGLDDCVEWIQEAVELLPEHRRLVLVPTKITYRVNDTYKERARPTDEVIDRIARVEGESPVIFPIGWVHRFFVELDANPLQEFLPGCQSLERFVIKDENKKKKENAIEYPTVSSDRESKQRVDIRFSQSGVSVAKYLGAHLPIVRLRGSLKSPPGYEKLLVRRWLEMRSSPWQWFSSDQINCKMVVRDLKIDRETGTWTLDLQRYSGSETEPRHPQFR